MKRWMPLLLILVAAVLPVSCRRSSNETSSTQEKETPAGKHHGASKREDPQSESVIIDNVKVRKDPKGGWFGPSLRDVYLKGEDTPVLFCDSGPAFPTGKLVTIFYREAESKPDSSACRAAVAVIEGEGVWKDGKAITMDELAQMREQEEHFHQENLGYLASGRGEMTFAWRKPKPIGDPCPDTSGAPNDVARRYKGQKCSIVVVYPHDYTPFVFFVNWKVVGVDDAAGGDKDGPSPSPREVIQTITAQYGSKYVVSK
jgi:hypothetical protein